MFQQFLLHSAPLVGNQLQCLPHLLLNPLGQRRQPLLPDPLPNRLPQRSLLLDHHGDLRLQLSIPGINRSPLPGRNVGQISLFRRLPLLHVERWLEARHQPVVVPLW